MADSVFIDVGAHEGQTVEAAIRYPFRHIVAIEPMPREFRILQARFGDDPRVICCNVALGDRSGLTTMYGDNAELEASIWPSKIDVDPTITTTVVMLEARKLISDLAHCDLYLKLNCEGAEVPILTNLLGSGQLRWVARALIDWDIGKVAGRQHLETDVAQKLADAGFDRWDYWPEGLDHADRVTRWIEAHSELRQ